MAVANSSTFKSGDAVWVINPQGLALLERPDLNASTLEVARFGTRLRIAEEPRTWRGAEQWLRVETDDGRDFWIASGPADTPFVSTVRPADAFDVIVRDAPADGLNVRSDQNPQAPIVDLVRNGERLTVFVADYQASGGTWYGVETPRKQFGWVLDQSSRWLQRITTDEPAAHSTIENNIPSRDRWVSTEYNLSLRSHPLRTANTIATLPRGAHVLAMSELSEVDQDGIAWQEVQTDDGRRGWVAAEERGTPTLSNTSLATVVTSGIAPGSASPVQSVQPPSVEYNEAPNFEQVSFAPQAQTAYPGTSTAPGDTSVAPADYSFKLDVTNWPDMVAPGEKVELKIVLQNLSNQRWVNAVTSPGGGQPVEVAYQIVRGTKEVVNQGTRTLDEPIEPGEEVNLTEPFDVPISPGDYQVFWTVALETEPEWLSAVARRRVKPLSLKVLDLPRVQQALDGQLPDDTNERDALVETMGELLQRAIDPEWQQRIVDQGLIPAVFDPDSAKVAKAALYGLYEARRVDSYIEPKLKEAFAARPDDVAVLRDRLKKSFRKEVRSWVQQLLPSVQEPVIDEEIVETETTAETNREKKTDQADKSPQGRIVQQIIITPPSQQYARPPVERRVTVTVAKDAVKLECGGDAYASPNRLDYKELDKARLISPEKYGRQLFDGLFNAEVLPPFQGSTSVGYAKYVHGETGFIFELEIAPTEPTLNLLKWEYLIGSNGAPLAVVKQSPFFRRMGNRTLDTRPTWPLRVLVAICNPVTLGMPVDDEGYPIDAQGQRANLNIAGLKVIDVEREHTIVTDALDQVAKFGAVKYTLLDGSRHQPVTLAALRQALHDDEYHVLHIIAHGVPIFDHFHLVMEDDHRREDLVPVEKFDQARFGGLRLVVLDTCQSASLTVKGVLHGLTPHLIGLGVPAVVSMQDLVPVPTAQHFTQWFYHHLARSGRIDMAMVATRLQLHDEDKRSWNWGIPVLTMSSDDGQLFDVSDDQVQQQHMPDSITPHERRFAEKSTTDQALRSYLASQAAQLGASPALVGAYSRWSAQPPALPLLDPQKRADLTRVIKQPVDINADQLAEFVNPKDGQGLQLDKAAFEHIASALNAGKHIILIGPPGTGKTTLAQRICEYAKGQECAGGHVLTTATADWTTFDTVGGYVPTQQQTLEFRPGAFLRAIREGQWLIIDEINRAEIDKAFGELFTLLSGQAVNLPYTVCDQPVRVRPPKSADPQDWIPDDLKDSTDDYHYVVHPTWRIVGTMNVYDKSYLFAMSFAFMRRFAFIDCDLPGIEDTGQLDAEGKPITIDHYAQLIERWVTAAGLDGIGLHKHLETLVDRRNLLMQRRALGPAILRDMIGFVKDRRRQANGATALNLLGEAFLLYAVPQFDGLDRDDILRIHDELKAVFAAAEPRVLAGLLGRIKLLYPHIPPVEWDKVRQPHA